MHEANTIKELSAKRILKTVAPFLVLAVVIAVVHFTGLDDSLNEEWIDQHIRNHGWQGYLVFTGLVAFFTALAVPRQVMSFLGGYAFGAVFGTLWVTIGATIGCILAFYYARFAAKETLQRRYGHHVAKFDRFFARNPLSMSIVIRCLPLGNNLITSMTAGVSSIPAPQFFIGSFIGYIPQNAIFALLGSGITVSPVARTVVSGVLLVLSGIFGYYLLKKYRTESVIETGLSENRNQCE